MRFFPVAEAPAFATFLPDVAGREGVRCVVFLRFGFLASAAIQISPRRMLGALVHRTPPGTASYRAKLPNRSRTHGHPAQTLGVRKLVSRYQVRQADFCRSAALLPFARTFASIGEHSKHLHWLD